MSTPPSVPEQGTSDDSTATGDESSALDVARLAKWAEVLTPATLVSALFLYFSWIRTRSYFGYFGVDAGLLQYSTQDYLLRSIDTTFGTAVRVLTLAVLLLLIDRVLQPWRIPGRNDLVARWLPLGLPLAGMVLALAGVLVALGEIPLPLAPVAGSMMLVLGSLITARDSAILASLLKVGARTVRALALAAIVLGAFWAASLYAQQLGGENARLVEQEPTSLPLVTVFSNTYLDLPGSLVITTRVLSPEGKAQYRYTGLRLLAYSDHRWFLVSGRSSRAFRPSVTIIDEQDGLRFEVSTES